MDLTEYETEILTAVFLIAVYQTWGLGKQWRTIVNRKSGKAVSPYVHIANLAYFYASLTYSVMSVRKLQGIAAFSSGVLTALVIFSLRKYEKWGMKEYLAISMLPVWLIVVALIESGEGQSFAIISVVAVLTTFTQPFKIWRAKNAGSVDLRFTVSFAVGAVFWALYGFVTHEPVNSVVCPIFFVSHISTIILYYRYRPVPVVVGATG